MNREINDHFILGGCGSNSEWAGRNGSNNFADLLPADPFEMNLNTHLFMMDWDTTISAAIARLIGASPDDYQVDRGDIINGLNYYWNETLLPSSFTCMNVGSGVNNIYSQGFSSSFCSFGRGSSFGHPRPVKDDASVSNKGDTVVVGEGGNNLHDGLLFSLGYLGLQDLLSIERVCRSLRSAVRNDVLLWRCIHINSALSEGITDNDIFQLTQRAQGSLQCLSLEGCSKITDDGLKRVLETNPRIRKLSVPGCLGLSVEGIIDNLRSLKLSGMPGIMTLKLGRLFIISPKHFEELKLLVGGEMHHSKYHSLQFYNKNSSSTACEDDYGIDINLCPVCQKYKLVYDCPSENCRSKGPEHCRACDACIARCSECGKCVNNCKYTETFCLRYICSGCWKPPFQG